MRPFHTSCPGHRIKSSYVLPEGNQYAHTVCFSSGPQRIADELKDPKDTSVLSVHRQPRFSIFLAASGSSAFAAVVFDGHSLGGRLFVLVSAAVYEDGKRHDLFAGAYK